MDGKAAGVDSGKKIFHYLVNTNNGEWLPIVKGYVRDMFTFSPAGKYVFWYSVKDRCYLTYDIFNGIIRNVSKKYSGQDILMS